MIPHNKPSLGKGEIEAVTEVIKSGFIAQGVKVKELEKKLSYLIGKTYCVCVSSGSAALFLTLRALGIKHGDEVIIPSYTCSALWHAVKSNDAIPVLADIEEETFNLDPEDVKKKITKKTKAIIFPHMFGQPGFIKEITDYGIPVIEDIAQSLGAKIEEKQTGYYGQITVVSFYATKFIAAGEGGAVLTNDHRIYKKTIDMREYDEKEKLTPRFNYKMTDIEAAIALKQLEKLSTFIKKRQKIYTEYENILKQYLQIPNIGIKSFEPNFFRVIAYHPNLSPEEIMTEALKMGITIRKPVFKPLHKYSFDTTLPVTDKAWNSQFSLPIYPTLKRRDLKRILQFLERHYV
ncbi:MAG: hypothetical protein DRP91_02030 [Candidatus Neomarinimicrobiota bacterium]|nr:MAG: hypothetical protein DRP91_02030 [Candidatus Neomarinimicrobiota bacterium]